MRVLQKASDRAKRFKVGARKERGGGGIWPRVCPRTGTGAPSDRCSLLWKRREQLVNSNVFEIFSTPAAPRHVLRVDPDTLSRHHLPNLGKITSFWVSTHQQGTSSPLDMNGHIKHDPFPLSVHLSIRHLYTLRMTWHVLWPDTFFIFTSYSTTCFSAIFQEPQFLY